MSDYKPDRELIILAESSIGDSELNGRFFETEWGVFKNIRELEIFGARNIKHTKWRGANRVTRGTGDAKEITYEYVTAVNFPVNRYEE